MSIVICNKNDIVSVANKIRDMSGSNRKMSFPQDFQTNIEDLGYDLLDKASFKEYFNKTLTDLPAYALAGSSIESVDIPNAENIGDYAFADCKNLKSVNLPNAETIGKYAFSQSDIYWVYYYPTVTSFDVYLPNAKILKEGAFSGSAINTLDAPEVIEVGQFAFMDTKYLTTVNMPKLQRFEETSEPVGIIPFYNSAITYFDAPEVKYLPGCTFLNCEIVGVNFPQATYVGTECFSNCNKLAKVNFESAVTIMDYAFNSCENLKELDLPSAVSIGSYCAQSCYSLRKVTLGSITEIGDHAFSGSALNTLIIAQPNNVCSLMSTDAFDFTPISEGTGFIYVPDTLVQSYKTATNWSVFANQIKPLSEYVFCTNVAMNYNQINISNGQPYTLTATVSPSNTLETLKWSSSDISIAYVVDGIVYPKKNGTCTISVECGKKSASCTVTVSGMSNIIHDEAIYQLSEDTLFTGFNKVDIGSNVMKNCVDFTILADITFDQSFSEGNILTYKPENDPSQSGIINLQCYKDCYQGAMTFNLAVNGSYPYLQIPLSENVLNCKIGITTFEDNIRFIISSGDTIIADTVSYNKISIDGEFTLGAYAQSNGSFTDFFRGVIHDFAIYDRSMTQEEIMSYLA